MHSLSELQKHVQSLTDQIDDIFHATGLNLQALSVQVDSCSDSQITTALLTQCRKEFARLQALFKERASLRLQYLITEQIKEEQAKVRKERLVEYQEKIYDQRRLISDKEAFYEGLLKPRKKRPAHMTVQEFQSQRRQEMAMEERKNIRFLEQQTYQLKQISKALSGENQQLQQALDRFDRQQVPIEDLQRLQYLLTKNPTMYDNLGKMTAKRDDRQQIAATLEYVSQIQEQNQSIFGQYKEERELYQYLKWQHAKLKEQYMQANQNRQQKMKQNRHNIINIEKQGRYRLRRAVSI